MTLPEETQAFVLSWTILVYGNFNPITWITSNYIHADIFHLVGNMLAMWVFGLIVEGKLGPWKFLLLYNALGFLQCGVEQTLMIFASEGGSLGASAIIYGLMAVCLVWAPSNDLYCVSRWGMIEVSVMTFVGLMLFMELAFAGLHVSMAPSPLLAICSEVLHLMGAATGAAAGIFLLKSKLVDCENWDIFSVYAGNHLKSRDELNKDYMQSAEFKQKEQQSREALIEQLRADLAANQSIAAWAAYKRGLNQFPNFTLPEGDHLNLIACMRKTTLYDETITLMVSFLKSYPQRANNVRLALAQILIEKKERGKQAMEVLQKVDPGQLDARFREPFERMMARAMELVEENPYEVAPENW
jgi:membrane associated rhomboid family serine protease